MKKLMNDYSDLNIIKRISLGDESAFNSLFDRYYVSLCYFANRYLKDIDSSRSLVQQLFVDIWEKREDIFIDRSIRAYLFMATKNRAIDFLRLTKNRVYSFDSENDLLQIPFYDQVEEAELSDLINSCINQMPDRCREVFMLSRHEGLKYTEIALKLNISVKTVEMQMGIALQKLRGLVKNK
jgi:RNA polymerase sigma-70 factor (ECF subfamily)